MGKKNTVDNCFKGLDEDKEKDYLKKIRSFFYKKLPELVKISQSPVFKNIHNMSIAELGVEGALEGFISLFYDGLLWIYSENKKDYIITILADGDLILLFDSTE